MQEQTKLTGFERAVLPHLAAAYNLARWLTRNPHDAEDVVQEAYLRAFRFFAGFHGGDSRAWLLKIVRNVFYSWTTQNEARRPAAIADEEIEQIKSHAPDPEARLLRLADGQRLRDALERLPVDYREVIILREIEEMSYKEIAEVVNVPLGTVMSRLARARKQLHQHLTTDERRGVSP